MPWHSSLMVCIMASQILTMLLRLRYGNQSSIDCRLFFFLLAIKFLNFVWIGQIVVGIVSSLVLLYAPSVFGLAGVWAGLTTLMGLRMVAGIVRWLWFLFVVLLCAKYTCKYDTTCNKIVWCIPYHMPLGRMWYCFFFWIWSTPLFSDTLLCSRLSAVIGKISGWCGNQDLGHFCIRRNRNPRSVYYYLVSSYNIACRGTLYPASNYVYLWEYRLKLTRDEVMWLCDSLRTARS
jgi:hypothetical protein